MLLPQLISWFARHKRALPWRAEPRDPYHVWLSEVMLQQTQVASVIPYFERWLAQFPTVRALAAAPLDDVLKAWQGLGYYARARNLQRAAQTVVTEHGGIFPDTVDALRALPGIGRYTAGAIASLAFGRDAAVLDGNVKRVLSRLYALPAASEAELWARAEELLPPGQAGAHNEAMMELGATVCTPLAPRCVECPLRVECRGFALGTPTAFPAGVVKKPTLLHTVATAVVVGPHGHVLLAQRPPQGLLGGLWEFVSAQYGVQGAASDEIDVMVSLRTGLAIAPDAREIGVVKHAFTHFRIVRRVWLVHTPGGTLNPNGYAALRWCAPDEIAALALTRSDERILALLASFRSTSGI